MRRGIVEGDDYSVLPAPVVRLAKWLRDRLGRRTSTEAPAPSDDDIDDNDDDTAR